MTKHGTRGYRKYLVGSVVNGWRVLEHANPGYVVECPQCGGAVHYRSACFTAKATCKNCHRSRAWLYTVYEWWHQWGTAWITKHDWHGLYGRSVKSSDRQFERLKARFRLWAVPHEHRQDPDTNLSQVRLTYRAGKWVADQFNATAGAMPGPVGPTPSTPRSPHSPHSPHSPRSGT